MIDQINAFYHCWYLSPPWHSQIPPLEVNLLERVYICTTRTFGYCCGIQWKQDRWIYAIDCNRDIVHATKHQIIATGQIQTTTLEKPAFKLGERVMLCSHHEGTKQRLVLGIQLVNNSWFYFVEWMPPALEEISLDSRLALVSERDLVRVNV
jgi:Protein of unknown function (DUF1392)